MPLRDVPVLEKPFTAADLNEVILSYQLVGRVQLPV
jgi:hypothetical protein